MSSPLFLSSAFSTANGHLPHLSPRPATCPSPGFASKPTLAPTATFFYRESVHPRFSCCCCCSSSSSSSSSSMPLELSTSASDQDDDLGDSLLYSRAYWVSESIIAWNVDVPDGSCYLYASRTAALSISYDGIQGAEVEIELQEDRGGLPANVIEKFPHIRDYKAFKVPASSVAKSLLKCQLAVATYNSDRKCSDATGLQLPGILDELFSYDGPLGALYAEETVSLYLWAPTAQSVSACIYRDPLGENPLEVVQLKENDGVWSIKGPKSWEGCYYVYEVSVYHPSTLQIEKCYANDPYARGYAGCLS